MEELKFPDLSVEMERLSKALTEIGQGFTQCAEAIGDAFRKVAEQYFSPLVSGIGEYLAELKKDEKDRERALKLGLVSRRVVDLSYRKDRVGNKNLNRIRKSLALWDKRNKPYKTRTCFTDPVKGDISLENGVIQETGVMDMG